MDMKMTTWTHHSDRGWKTQKANSKICQSENVSENMQVDLTEDFSQAFPDTEYTENAEYDPNAEYEEYSGYEENALYQDDMT